MKSHFLLCLTEEKPNLTVTSPKILSNRHLALGLFELVTVQCYQRIRAYENRKV